MMVDMGDNIRVEVDVDFEDIADVLAVNPDKAYELIKEIDKNVADANFTIDVIKGLAKDLDADLPGINANIEKAISMVEGITTEKKYTMPKA